jgi:tRNA(Arg) A34 adenosine deaminase TadA
MSATTFMRRYIEVAEKAALTGDTPVGARCS